MRARLPEGRRTGDRLLHHPRTAMALKAGVAASVAWLVAQHLPDPMSDYAFYAPLGAVVTLYPTVVSSVEQSVRAVLSIGLGVALGIGADALLGSTPVVVAVVVVVGVLLAGLRVLGDQRVYVPTAAVFVLILGQGDEVGYGVAYAVCFLLGAAIAVVTNVLLPATLGHEVDRAQARLREALVAHLEHLAHRFAGSDDDDVPARSGLTELTTQARRVTLEACEAARANRRARRRPGEALHRYDAFRALERVVLLVDDVYELLAERPWDADPLSGPDALRAPMSRALSELAGAVRDVGVRDPDPDQRRRALRAVDDLTAALTRRRRDTDAPHAEDLVVATISTSLRRCLAVVTPPELLTR